MEIRCLTYDALSKNELYDLLALRCKVFIVEQDCPYQDIDGKDQQAMHILGYEGEQLQAYTRIFRPGDYFQEASIGRVVTHPSARGRKLGLAIMKASLDWLENELPGETIHLSAQLYLERFYRSLGFIPEGEPYLEDDIPHIAMYKR